MNVMQYAAVAEKNWKMNLAEMSGFQPKYTFYADFSVAEFCEVYLRDANAVKKTFNQVVKSWGTDYKAMTEIVMVLNHKSWAFAQKVDSKYLGLGDTRANEFAILYTELYYKADEMFCNKFKGNADAMAYYYEVTD